MKKCVFEGPYNRNRKDASKKLIAVLIKILIAFTVFLTQPVTDDQIWKKFVFNKEMTSIMQPSTG